MLDVRTSGDDEAGDSGDAGAARAGRTIESILHTDAPTLMNASGGERHDSADAGAGADFCCLPPAFRFLSWGFPSPACSSVFRPALGSTAALLQAERELGWERGGVRLTGLGLKHDLTG